MPSVWIHNSGFKPASSNTQLASWITERFYGSVGDTHEEFGRGSCCFAADCEQSLQISGGFWIERCQAKALAHIYRPA